MPDNVESCEATRACLRDRNHPGKCVTAADLVKVAPSI